MTLRIGADERWRIELTVNGRVRVGHAEPRMLLTDFLRHELQMFGVHVGCTILRDGKAVRSCTQYAVQAEGAEIVTVEGLSPEGGLNVLQRAFTRHHALQCGFCTAGILMSATHFLKKNPKPTEPEVRDMLSGHICRCTGYASIVAAILDAAREAAGGE
jgi:2-furoyl-CoA dehydrogenase 2Fe-2S iron sulfur subunit